MCGRSEGCRTTAALPPTADLARPGNERLLVTQPDVAPVTRPLDLSVAVTNPNPTPAGLGQTAEDLRVGAKGVVAFD